MSAAQEVEAWLVTVAQGPLDRGEVAELRKQITLLVKQTRTNEAEQCAELIENMAIATNNEDRRGAFMSAAWAVREHRLKK